MSEGVSDAPQPSISYSSRTRTALVLAGTGTAGAYHAGVLRALVEAGIRIDLVAGHGMGAVSAACAAVDGNQRLWGPKGLWRNGAFKRFYRWRVPYRALGWVLGLSLAVVLVPLALLAIGLLVYLLGFLLRIASIPAGGWLIQAYLDWLATAMSPEALPTILPRVVVLLVLVPLLVLLAAGVHRRARVWRFRRGGGPGFLGSPLESLDIKRHVRRGLWQLISGTSGFREPGQVEMSRRYVELLRENLGQPGFRELLVLVHDLDARRDLVFGLLREPYRTASFGDKGDRADEAFDINGVAREMLADVLLGAVSIPPVTEPHRMSFLPASHWRGETHRVCDRPDSVPRLLEEVHRAGVEQVILVFPWSQQFEPHGLSSGRTDLRGHAGEHLAAAGAASSRDAVAAWNRVFSRLFFIAPRHNPVGPFDFGGSYDERSDRWHSLGELMDRGYEDAFRQFVDPEVAGEGEAWSQVQTRQQPVVEVGRQHRDR
jgi:hypothetical protein